MQLLDEDAYADVRSIHKAMERRQAPFYLRRTKELDGLFPGARDERRVHLTAKPVFTIGIPRADDFAIDGPDFELY